MPGEMQPGHRVKSSFRLSDRGSHCTSPLLLLMTGGVRCPAKLLPVYCSVKQLLGLGSR